MLEDSVARWFSSEVATTVYEPDVMYAAGRMLATVDRITIGGSERPVEIKTTNRYLDDPEPYWIDQCQAIMLCTGRDSIDLVWLDSSLDLHYEEVDADERHQADMLARAERFMAAIDMGIVPDWIVPDLTAGHISAIYPEPTGAIELDSAVAELVSDYLNLRETQAEAKRAMESIHDEVVRHLGDYAIGTHEGVPIVTFKAIKGAEAFDADALRRDHPELWGEYAYTKPGGRRFAAVG